MKILIVGAGSIGVYLGTHLFAEGHDVILLGRKKLKKLGSTILIDNSVFHIPAKIYKLPQNKSYDVIFICSKLYDLAKNLQSLDKNNIKAQFVVSIQNGIVDKSVLNNYTFQTEFGSISVFEGFRLVENQLTIARASGGWRTDKSPAGRMTCELLKKCNINIEMDDHFEETKAEKTIMNCAVNLLSAIQKKTVFEICHEPATRKIVDALFDESYTVLSQTYKLHGKEELRARFNQTIAPLQHYSSTYQDAISGRKAEVAFLNGLILRSANELHISVPQTQQLISEFFKKYPNSA